MKTVELNVEGMSCGNCVKSVTKAVLSLKSVKSCDVDLAKKKATVTYDDSLTSIQNIIDKINDIGFEAFK